MLLCPKENQPAHDLAETPAALAAAIVAHFQPTGRVLDPCRGTGAFYDCLVGRPGITAADWCEIRQGVDFFDWHLPVDWIITNPPWSILRQFLGHAMRLADNVVFLVTLTHLDTRARDRDIQLAGFGRREALLCPQPRAPWPTSGFLLAAYHLQKGYAGPLTFNRSLLVPRRKKIRRRTDLPMSGVSSVDSAAPARAPATDQARRGWHSH